MLFLYKDQVIQSDLGFDNILGLSPPPLLQKQQQKKEHNIIKVSDDIVSYNFHIEIYVIFLFVLFILRWVCICLFDLL